MQTTVARSHAALLATPARRSSSRQALAGGTGCSRASRRRPQQQGAVCLAPAAFLAAGSVAPTASLVAGGLQAVAWASALIMAGRLYLQQQVSARLLLVTPAGCAWPAISKPQPISRARAHPTRLPPTRHRPPTNPPRLACLPCCRASQMTAPGRSATPATAAAPWSAGAHAGATMTAGAAPAAAAVAWCAAAAAAAGLPCPLRRA